MPLYEYFCQNCQKSFEELRIYSQADEERDCPFCGSAQTRRKLSKVSSFSEGKSLSSSGPSCSSCSGGHCSHCGG